MRKNVQGAYVNKMRMSNISEVVLKQHPEKSIQRRVIQKHTMYSMNCRTEPTPTRKSDITATLVAN